MKKILLVLSTLSLAACGGGGGGGSSDIMEVAIDSRNAGTVAGAMVEYAESISDLQYLLPAEMTLRSRSPSDKPSDASISSLYRFAHDRLFNPYSGTTLSNQTRSTAVTDYCHSGNVVYTYALGDDGHANAAGEYLQIAFNQCTYHYADYYYEYTETYNGTLKVTLDGWTSEQDFVAGMLLNLSYRSVEDYYGDRYRWEESIKGDITLGYSDSGTRMVISSDVMEYSNNYSDQSVRNLHASFDFFEGGMQSDLSVDLFTSEMGGYVSINTITPLVYYWTGYSSYPVMGEITATGANGTFVSLDADTSNEDTARLTLYDGVSTSSRNVYWYDLYY